VVAAAVAAGQRVFGENRVQEALGKAEACGPGIAWHLIGHLQGNKAKAAARIFDVVESLDSLELAVNLDRRAGEAGRRLRVLVGEMAEEAAKSGVASDAGMLAARLPNLNSRADDHPAAARGRIPRLVRAPARCASFGTGVLSGPGGTRWG
jgi:hypothetical protein